MVGPPGTAKSEAVRRIARGLGGAYFEYLLGRFTEPNEIFGPVDLTKLRQGVVESRTEGMLPEADIAFLDEVFLGSTAILNTLLGILNERVYRRGHTARECPLRVCVGASNALPTEDALAAFADRFLLRVFVEPIADPELESLLEGGWQLGAGADTASQTVASLGDLDTLREAARRCDLAALRPELAQAIRTLRGAGIQLTDRRAVKTQKLVAAAAVLAGRRQPTAADLWPLVFAVPNPEEQDLARDVLKGLLDRSESQALSHAAELASLGPRARATRLLEVGRELLAAKPEAEGDQERWRLRLEGLLRELDAGFSEETRGEELDALRRELKGALAP